MAIKWYVVYTQPAREFLAERHLVDQGYTVYMPRFLKICRHARKVEEKLVPLFPRYLFINMDLLTVPWHSVNGTRGVSHLLVSGEGMPCSMPDSIVENLKTQESQKGDVPLSSLAPFVKDQKIRITEGTFKDQEGIFDCMDDKSRARIFLDFMGRTMNVSLPAYTISSS